MKLEKTEKLKISQIKESVNNPREITSEKFMQLVRSILVFPKMQIIRPIVIDGKNEVIGGNMRLRALKKISTMSIDDIKSTLSKVNDFKEKAQGEKEAVVKWWNEWIGSPYAFVINASELTENERKQFVIKDNVSSGQWDFEALANKWNTESLNDWGVPVWNTDSLSFGNDFGSSESNTDTSGNSSSVDFEAGEETQSGNLNVEESFGGNSLDNLPPELQGLDLQPNELPKLQGSDETAMNRVIIVYPSEREQDVAMLLGLAKIDKVVYNIHEITGEDIAADNANEK